MAWAVEARGLVKTYRRHRAVEGIDLTLGVGERVALLGANGAGKTTTLLMLLGAITPDQGTIEVLGHRLPDERSLAMERVGFAAGYLPLPDKLRVREMLGFFANLYGIARPGPTVEAGLARFGISHLASAWTAELSSGQRTLVGLVKATLHRPQLLVLDEPTASLDPDVARRVRDGLQRVWEEGDTTMLITSHNMTDVERICERVVFLSGGRIVANGSPPEVAEQFGRADLEEVFIHLASEEM